MKELDLDKIKSIKDLVALLKVLHPKIVVSGKALEKISHLVK